MLLSETMHLLQAPVSAPPGPDPNHYRRGGWGSGSGSGCTFFLFRGGGGGWGSGSGSRSGSRVHSGRGGFGSGSGPGGTSFFLRGGDSGSGSGSGRSPGGGGWSSGSGVREFGFLGLDPWGEGGVPVQVRVRVGLVMSSTAARGGRREAFKVRWIHLLQASAEVQCRRNLSRRAKIGTPRTPLG